MMSFMQIFHVKKLNFHYHSIPQVQVIVRVQDMSLVMSREHYSSLRAYVNEILLNEYLGIEWLLEYLLCQYTN